MKKSFLLVCSIFVFALLPAQKPLDRIAAIVGEEVILESDIDNQYNYLMSKKNVKDKSELRCKAFEELIVGKVLLAKAEQDSLTVSEDEIAAELEKRVNTMIENVDGVANLEKIIGKPLSLYKSDLHDLVKNEILIDRQKNSVLAQADVTPKELQEFFQNIPKDSFGILPAEVEINHIVAIPPFSEASKKQAREKLERIRKEALEGSKSFTDLAKKYSQEPGASKSGGDLGEFGRGMMVPEFEAAVYAMRPGELSKIVETEFGYHLIRLNERRGEIVRAQHILVIPDRDVKGDSIALSRLNRALKLIKADSMNFQTAAIRFSQERESKDCGGCIQNPQTGELRIPIQQLDTEFFFKIDNMKEGEISAPMEYTMRDGTRAFHIIYLRHKIPPHKPNLKDDYQKIYKVAVQNKQAEVFDKWIRKARKNVYLDIKSNDCTAIVKDWKNPEK